MHFESAIIYLPSWIEVLVKMSPGEFTIDNLNCAYFDDFVGREQRRLPTCHQKGDVGENFRI